MNARRQRGFSLVEILIVIVILALAVGGITMGLGALGRSKLRSSCVRITAATRFAYHRAVTQGKTVRIVLDFDANAMSFEEAHGRVTLRDPSGDWTEEDEVGEDGADDPWARAQANLEGAIGAAMGRSAFGAIRDEDGEPMERYAARPFDGAQLSRLFTPHEVEPREDGKGYIYFFPGGQTEHAVVQLENRDQQVYSVEVMALTGHATIHPAAVEPEELTEEDLRDPG